MRISPLKQRKNQFVIKESGNKIMVRGGQSIGLPLSKRFLRTLSSVTRSWFLQRSTEAIYGNQYGESIENLVQL